MHVVADHSEHYPAPVHQRATKYFAAGRWQMMANVDCSGSSWYSSPSFTPIRPISTKSPTFSWSSWFGHAGYPHE